MKTKKPVYLLARGRTGSGRTPDPFIRAVFKDIGKAKPTIAYVGVANEDNKGFFERNQAVMKNTGNCRIIHALIYPEHAELTKTREILQSADGVFISGGDVNLGMRVLRRKGMIRVLRSLFEQGKVFFGASAGSIMLAGEWVRWKDPNDDSTAQLFPCLGLAPVVCDTHSEADDWDELKTALRLKEEGTYGYGITTGTCLKVFPDGEVEALGGAIFRYVKSRKNVKRQSDLLPNKN